jgi:ligand-binding sensor domain-containing protein
MKFVRLAAFTLLFGLALLALPSARAERLPVKIYTTADGLAHNHINRIRRDSRGFLWFCTDEGLSRFDGYRFTSYTKAHGLPHNWVNDLLEARDGSYWVATDGGVCRFNPVGKPAPFNPNDNQPSAISNPMITVYRVGEREDANRVIYLAEDRDGSIWCGTSEGLFRLERAGEKAQFHSVNIGPPGLARDEKYVVTLLVDRQGTLWIGAIKGLYRRWPDGRVERYGAQDGLPDEFIQLVRMRRETCGSVLVRTPVWSGAATGVSSGSLRLMASPMPRSVRFFSTTPSGCGQQAPRAV